MKRIRQENINTQDRYKKIIEGTDIAKIGFNTKWAELISQWMIKEGTILDIGCWKGEHLNYWSNKNTKLIPFGIDFTKEALDFCRVNFPQVNVEQIDITKPIPYNDNSYDIVVCLEVLEHLEDPKALVKQIIRLARKQVIVSVPWELQVKSPYHLWEFNKQDFEELFKELKNIKIYHSGKRMFLTGEK